MRTEDVARGGIAAIVAFFALSALFAFLTMHDLRSGLLGGALARVAPSPWTRVALLVLAALVGWAWAAWSASKRRRMAR